MWTLKIALLVVGVAVTAFANNSYSVACAAAASNVSAAAQSECLPRK